MVTYVWSVNSLDKRDKVITYIYNRLKEEREDLFIVKLQGVNRVSVYDARSKIEIRRYVVVVIPVILNTDALDNITGNVVYNLDETISTLQTVINKLRERQGKHFVKENNNAETLKQALSQLAR